MPPRHILTLAALLIVCAACAPVIATTPAPSAKAVPPILSVQPVMGKTIEATNIDGIECDGSGVATTVSVHISLAGTNGPEAPAPGIGVRTACSFWLHTDKDGVLVYGAPSGSVAPTIGAFLDIWAYSAPSDSTLARFVTALDAGAFKVNGTAGVSEGWRSIVLRDGDKITLGA